MKCLQCVAGSLLFLTAVAALLASSGRSTPSTQPLSIGTSAMPDDLVETKLSKSTLTGALSVTKGVGESRNSIKAKDVASSGWVLSGECRGVTVLRNECGTAPSAACPAGKAAISPTNFLCGTAGYVPIDNSRGCSGKVRTLTFYGRCGIVRASGSSSVVANNKSCKAGPRIEE